MKIGFDISDLHAGKADGTTRFTYELAKRLPALAPQHEWLFFSSGRASTHYSLPTTNYKLIVSSWPRYWTQMRLPVDLYRYQPDVLFMPIQQLPFFRPGKMKTVATVHDLAFHVYPEYFTYKDWLLQHIFTSYAVREADHIIAVSQATASDTKKYYGRTQDVTAIHHGLDHERFRPPVSEDERADGWEQLQVWAPQLRRPYILYVGQIQPRKNLVRLIEAFENLNSSFQLVLAGSHGWLNEPIYQRVKTSSVAKRILMPGRVPDDLLPALYWHAEVFVLPSLYEGFGMPLVEAMSCGCPVVTSTVSVMPEVVGEAAVVVDPKSPEDIVRGIMEARQSSEKLRAAGLVRAAHFSWDRCAHHILDVINHV